MKVKQAITPEDKALVGKQAGSESFLDFHLEDIYLEYEKLSAMGLNITYQEYPWVEFAIFQDLYGNTIALSRWFSEDQ